ncbi:YbjQ family protein [Thermus caldifontis]|uniref:YbjQ family protein n=1 Tax=Thermus caldifontis TaxID=1930763 RepID=UPI0013B3D042|nr:YbjQ family protein [Thermus caldifontis]
MDILLTTLGEVPGYRVAQVLGVVKGSTVRTKHLGKDLLAGLRTLVGGEIPEYTEMLKEAREEAERRMLEEAKRLGAHAILGVRYATASVLQGAAEILVYGTAVRLEPVRERY